ncbi:MAG: hypothetical protein ACR2PI_27885 [Hyphomicrobiaceae bacterium]
MRVILLLLFALAIGKVATQHYIRQQAADNTIINAYRTYAMAACQQYAADPNAFSTPVSIKLEIGNKNLSVQLWQTSHRQWAARYQDPVIVIETESGGLTSICAYDINSGAVLAHRPIPHRRRNG